MSESVPNGWKLHRLGDVILEKVLKTTKNNQHPALSVTKEGIFLQRDYFKKQIASEDNKGYKVIKRGHLVFSAMNLWMGSLDVLLKYEVGMVSPAYSIFRFNESIVDIFFMNYFLKTPHMIHIYELNSQQGASIVRRSLDKVGLLNELIPIPLLTEQQKIASILTSVDTVIEKTEAQINKLKDLKKAMMQELLTKGIGHTEFKDSPIGRIPVGWEVVFIKDLGKLITGNTPETKDQLNYGGDVPFISPADLGEEVYVSITNNYLTKKGLSKSRPLPKDTVLVVCIGSTIGKTGMTSQLSTSNQQVNSIVCKNNDSKFVYYCMSYLSKHIKSMAGTQAVPIINKTEFGNLITIRPRLEEQQEISKILFSIDTNMKSKKTQLFHIKSLKKALMQDLLTGKVRVAV